MKDDINELDEINKGACMGRDSIKYALDLTEEIKLKKILKKQHNEYLKIIKRIENLYSKYSSKSPHQTNKITKVMTWYGIEMRINKEDNSTKIAELYIKGTTMGIIEGRKLLNNKNISKKVNKIINDFVLMQEKSVEELKTFL